MGRNELRLLGAWFSPIAVRVRIALNIKDLEYENIEENLNSKSDLLLESNPVYKKIPVLLHEDKIICESAIIIEYIDEVWKNNGHSILPSNAYDRAIARFWVAYIDDKWFRSLQNADKSNFEQMEEVIVTLEDVFNKYSEGNKYFGGDKIGVIDIAFGGYLGWMRIIEKRTGKNILDEAKTPGLIKWATAFITHPAVKGVLPETNKLIEFAASAASKYESNDFFDQTTLPGNSMICGNQTATVSTSFTTTAQQVLIDLQTATPKIPGFFAATKTLVAGSTAIYAFAQCAETETENGCLDCLTVGFNNIQSCLPNSDGRAFDAGCFMRYSQTSFFADNQTIDITPFLNQGGSSKKGAIIGGVVGGVALIIVILLALFAWFWWHKKPKRQPRGDILGATELRGPVTYRYKDLKLATKNFSDENKLGEGGFGDVYKGTLKNGNIVAVKKLLLGQSGKMVEQFESEVKLISNVHHRNLVRLLGCCSKGQERILVYEYMSNNSLDRFLFGEKKGSLNWKQRYDIILGTARGLAYLHEDFHVCIIHRDIKSNNILLDDDLQPRIADFGLARLLPEDQSHLSTKFAGTLGYTAPEYAIHGQLSVKADTYSYGVVVLEIISGQRSSELRVEEDGDFLLQKAWKLYEADRHLELVDKTLSPDDYDSTEVKKIIEIALLCTQASAATRPTMSEIVALFKNKNLLEHMKPTMPVFVDSNLRPRADTSTSTASSTSNATASISILSAR